MLYTLYKHMRGSGNTMIGARFALQLSRVAMQLQMKGEW